MATAVLPAGGISEGGALAAATTFGFALAPPSAGWLFFLFICSGVYIAAEEKVEKAYAASLLPADRRGTGMGLLAATHGIGDMVSSALVGTPWALFPSPGGASASPPSSNLRSRPG